MKSRMIEMNQARQIIKDRTQWALLSLIALRLAAKGHEVTSKKIVAVFNSVQKKGASSEFSLHDLNT